MTIEEIKNRIIEFETMMSKFHNNNTGYGGRYKNSLFLISHIMNAFGKGRHQKIYEKLLEDLKLVYNQMPYEDYMQLRYRIISAYEA